MGDRELADSLRRTFREIAEEKSADRWLPILGGLVFLAGTIISALVSPGRASVVAPTEPNAFASTNIDFSRL